MNIKKYSVLLFAGLLSNQLLLAQTAAKAFKGQSALKGVPTENRAVTKQWKGIFTDADSTVFISNDFSGGRLNGMIRVNDTLYECLITSENTPVNESPWYAFKVWSKKNKTISIKLTYQNKVRHRYTPKISHDGVTWKSVEDGNKESAERKATYTFQIPVNADTTWISAQELVTSHHVNQWAASLEAVSKIDTMGYSHQGRPLKVLQIGNLSSKNIIVVLGRQHPPEVTGHYALTDFVETFAGRSALAKKFRKDFLMYVIPLPNPDGVEDGFWRHNAGGIDLNRDWSNFNQPESQAIRDYFGKQLSPEHTLYFMIDFHSTFHDIYYTLAPGLKRNTSGLLEKWMSRIHTAIPNYDPHIKPLYTEPPTVSAYSYFYEKYRAESLIFEIGDNTPRDFIRKKSKVSAEALMELLEANIIRSHK